MSSTTQASATIAAVPYQTTLNAASHQWIADEPAEVGGGNTGPTPMEMLLASLGACTSITLKMYANRKQWPLESVHVELQMTTGDGTQIQRKIALSGALSDEQRARLLQVANACPVHKVLTGSVQVDSTLVEPVAG